MSSSSSVLRMSGLNSGLDTESIVNALTATTKNKINTNRRALLKLQAQQEAYRDVISLFDTFSSKYFDILNSGTYLKSTTLFNSYKSTLSNSSGTTVVGVTSSCNALATPATYNVTVNKVATQSTLKSSTTSAKTTDFSECTDSSQTYAMSVTVGSTTKFVTFNGGTEEEIRDQINEQLADFGTTNDGSNRVYIDSDNKFTSTDTSSVTSTAVTLYSATQTLDISNLQTGSNTFTVTVDGTSKTVTFSTVASDYFDDLFDENGNLKDEDTIEEEGNTSKYTLFKEVAENERESEIYDGYTEWESTLTDDEKEALAQQIVSDQKQSELDAAESSLYDSAKEAVTLAAYNAAIEAGDIDEDTSYEDFAADYEVSDDKVEAYLSTDEGQELVAEYDAAVEEIEEKYADYDTSWDSLTTSEKMSYYEEHISTVASEEDYIASYTSTQAAQELNRANIENNLGALTFGTTSISASVDFESGTVTLTGYGSLTDSEVAFSITQSSDNATDMGISNTDTVGITSLVSTSSTLSSLGITADEDGNYNFSINGVDFSFSGDTTISKMMSTINSSSAGVKMTYTTLTNQFVLTSTEYGTGVDITVEDGDEGLMTALGFTSDAEFTEGTNTNLTINGVTVETASTSYTVDGTTFNFTQSAEGTSFTNEVTRDYSKALDAIKSFVEDYNQLISDIYAYLDEEPDSDYYFLTDDDIEDLDLSESQQTKWEAKAKQGLLYHDSTITSIMTKLRSVIYSTVEASDGTKIGLYTLGITTTSDYSKHGLLTYSDSMTDEEMEALFEQYADAFAELFTDSENGIAYQFDSIIESAIKTTGAESDRGVLVQKAGVSGTASATSNSIYRQITNLQSTIATLQERYEKQQDYYWSVYSNMETLLGSLNDQSSYISQLLGS